MAEMSESKHLSVSIARDIGYVYDFLSDPANFPKWASGLGTLRQVDGQWMAETPTGTMQVRFSGRNQYGVLDHWVITRPGVEIYIPFRVVVNGAGSKLIFTLFRPPGVDRDNFNADAEWVMRDLQAVKKYLEASGLKSKTS